MNIKYEGSIDRNDYIFPTGYIAVVRATYVEGIESRIKVGYLDMYHSVVEYKEHAYAYGTREKALEVAISKAKKFTDFYEEYNNQG